MPEPRISRRTREAVIRRAGACCEYCASQARFTPDPLSVEHIIPRARDGKSTLDNLALACQGCNGRKHISTHSLDPVSGELVRLYHPRTDAWAEHFTWDASNVLMVGLTPVGRATVAKLELNRPALQRLRRVLRAHGEHPPRGSVFIPE